MNLLWTGRDWKEESQIQPQRFQENHTQPGRPVKEALTNWVPPGILEHRKELQELSQSGYRWTAKCSQCNYSGE